ncbi:cold-shock protein [Candidatus Wolfebacteria bacterium]|nr:MAG: cold-shock protein [Candidatus Wolfebacteria bacterium]
MKHSETGTIATLHENGYGFIERKGAKDNIFFHLSNLIMVKFPQLKKGDELKFNVEENNKGGKAVQVMRKDAVVTPEADPKPQMIYED